MHPVIYSFLNLTLKFALRKYFKIKRERKKGRRRDIEREGEIWEIER